MDERTGRTARSGAARLARRMLHLLPLAAAAALLRCHGAEKSETAAATSVASSPAPSPSSPTAAPQRISSAPPARPAPAAQPVITQAIARGAAATAEAPTNDAQLRCVRRFHRAKEPVELRVAAPSTHGTLSIQVLDAAGKALGDFGVAPGIVDIRPLVPALDELPRAAWVQLLENGVPVGSAVVLEPLRSPASVRTMRALRKGTTDPYTRVIGWGDRLLDPTDADAVTASAQWIAAEPSVISGFGTEPEVDAIVVTDAGSIRLAFAPDAAPATVRNFITLAEQGFYDNTIFHRIVPMNREGQPFVIQGGDPTGTGDGGPGWNLAMEPSDLPHDFGVVGMARGDEPHSAGSQFYIALSRAGTARLDGQYTAFAYAVAGADTIRAIADRPIADAATGRPGDPPKVLRVDIVPAPPRAPGADRRAQRVKPAGADSPTKPSP